MNNKDLNQYIQNKIDEIDLIKAKWNAIIAQQAKDKEEIDTQYRVILNLLNNL